MDVHTRTMFFALAVSLCVDLNVVHSLNILGVFPAPLRSHFLVFQPYLQELAKRGHNVTVISYFADQNLSENYHDIDLSLDSSVINFNIPMKRSSILAFITMTVLHVTSAPYLCTTLLSNENVQTLWITQRKFDVIVVEQFDSDCALGLAYTLGAPVVGITSHMLLPWHYNRLGVPYNPAYVLFDFVEGGTKPTLLQRVQRSVWYYYFNFLNKYITQRLEQNIVADFFNDVPPLEELGRNVKFLLLYQNFILSGSTLLPGNVKEVGGYHIKKPKPLSGDILKFVEESEHGVIYISFGSNIKTSHLPQTNLEDIVAALNTLPQRVIWKWERNTLPENSTEFYASKWLPQNDILSHPKVLAFYSHCGLLGITEAIHYGVPTICMPIFGDQPSNAAAAEEAGIGVQIHINDLTKENILEKFNIVLNSQFREHVKLLSKAWHNRPISAMNSAIFWTEFAAKYNYTYRSSLADVPLYQYLCLDVFSALLPIALMFILCSKYIFSICCKRKFKIGKIKNKHE